MFFEDFSNGDFGKFMMIYFMLEVIQNGDGNGYLFVSKDSHSDQNGPLHGDFKTKHKGHLNNFIN